MLCMHCTGQFCRSLCPMAQWPSMPMSLLSSTRAAHCSSAPRWQPQSSRATSPHGMTQPLWPSTPTSRERMHLPSIQHTSILNQPFCSLHDVSKFHQKSTLQLNTPVTAPISRRLLLCGTPQLLWPSTPVSLHSMRQQIKLDRFLLMERCVSLQADPLMRLKKLSPHRHM